MCFHRSLSLDLESASDETTDGVKMNGSSNAYAYGSSDGSAPMSPLSSSLSSILQQPDESIPFVPLSPALLCDEYMLSLGDEQGISDLFDSCDLDTLALDDLLRIWTWYGLEVLHVFRSQTGVRPFLSPFTFFL